MTSQTELQNMDLHQKIDINNSATVMRVIDGWIYNVRYPNGRWSSVFVPQDSNKIQYMRVVGSQGVR